MKHGLILSLLLSVSAGCATSRGTLDLQLDPALSASAEATRGTVYIASIEDARRFELAPRDPSIPSLKDGQIDNPAITQRAIARKRNTYGKALGDILLPENRTVSDVIRENVTVALRNSGYQVTEARHPDASELTVRIDKFWSWVSPGFWAIQVLFDSEVFIQGNVPGVEEGHSIRAVAEQNHQAATSGAWQQTIGVGLANFRSDLQSKLTE